MYCGAANARITPVSAGIVTPRCLVLPIARWSCAGGSIACGTIAVPPCTWSRSWPPRRCLSRAPGSRWRPSRSACRTPWSPMRRSARVSASMTTDFRRGGPGSIPGVSRALTSVWIRRHRVCARRVLADAGVPASDVDLVIVATTTSELEPCLGTAPLVARHRPGRHRRGVPRRLGLHRVPLCAGRRRRRGRGRALALRSGHRRRLHDRASPPPPRPTAAAFAYGAGAVVLEQTAGQGRSASSRWSPMTPG